MPMFPGPGKVVAIHGESTDGAGGGDPPRWEPREKQPITVGFHLVRRSSPLALSAPNEQYSPKEY